MNIFFLHWIPKKCAKWHVDKHIIKMILESIQLLSSAHIMTNSEYIPPYKLTHKNHPCAIWVRESIWNYKWLVLLTNELCKEYTYRYGKVHACEKMLSNFINNIPSISDIPMTNPVLCMPEQYKDYNDPIKSYQTYYQYDKEKLHTWKYRNPPKWINKKLELTLE